MSLSAFIPYVRAQLQTLGYVEHFDEFDDQNIAATILDKTFMLTPGRLSSGSSRGVDFEWTYPLTIELFFRGYAQPSNAIDGAFLEVEKILDLVFEIEKRNSVIGLRDVYPTGLSFEPFSGDNDSIIKCKIDLTAKIHIYNSENCL
jgi:hypothetical protein